MNTKLSEIYKAIADFPTAESIGSGDPEKVGSTLFEFVSKHVKINADMNILDLGCGLGRSSAPFIDFLSNGKGYLVGVDVIERMVNFCRKVFEPRYENAAFYTCASVDSYLREEQMGMTSHPPIEKILERHKRFDLINAFSVFTHLLPEEMQSYFSLFDRILSPGGRLVLTFLFLDEWTRPKISNRALATMIRPDTPDEIGEIGNICFASPANPRAAVAISFEYILSMLKANGFQPEQIHFGSWRNIPSETFQDVLILQREQTVPVDFDPDCYLELNKDVAESGADPAQHYAVWGKIEGRSYKPLEESIPLDFDPNRYLELHKDVAESGINPAQHYVVWGKKEGRPYK